MEPFAAYVFRLRLRDGTFARAPKNHSTSQLYPVVLSSFVHAKVKERLHLNNELYRFEAKPQS